MVASGVYRVYLANAPLRELSPGEILWLPVLAQAETHTVAFTFKSSEGIDLSLSGLSVAIMSVKPDLTALSEDVNLTVVGNEARWALTPNQTYANEEDGYGDASAQLVIKSGGALVGVSSLLSVRFLKRLTKAAGG